PAGGWAGAGGRRAAMRGAGAGRGPRIWSVTPQSTSTPPMPIQNRPSPRHPPNIAARRWGGTVACQRTANAGGSVGDDAVLQRHGLGHHDRLLELEVRVVRLRRVELREVAGRLVR